MTESAEPASRHGEQAGGLEQAARRAVLEARDTLISKTYSVGRFRADDSMYGEDMAAFDHALDAYREAVAARVWREVLAEMNSDTDPSFVYRESRELEARGWKRINNPRTHILTREEHDRDAAHAPPNAMLFIVVDEGPEQTAEAARVDGAADEGREAEREDSARAEGPTEEGR